MSYIDIFSYIHVYLPFGQKNHFILFILIIFQILSFVENPFHQGQGDMSATQPKNTSEWQLYKVLQRANLLQYYDTFISQGTCVGNY